MGLFGTYSTNEEKPKRIRLIDLAKEKFDDELLIKELQLYLNSRKLAHNLPTRIAWKMQLDLLEKVPPKKRVSQVHTCTLKGYRAIAFENEERVSRTKKEVEIVKKGF